MEWHGSQNLHTPGVIPLCCTVSSQLNSWRGCVRSDILDFAVAVAVAAAAAAAAGAGAGAGAGGGVVVVVVVVVNF